MFTRHFFKYNVKEMILCLKHILLVLDIKKGLIRLKQQSAEEIH